MYSESKTINPPSLACFWMLDLFSYCDKNGMASGKMSKGERLSDL